MMNWLFKAMQDTMITIRTLECDICGRFDSLMLSLEEIEARAKTTEMDIGAYSIVHNDHTRIVYFDQKGVYLGDTIALSPEEIPENLQYQPLPFYIRNKKNLNIIRKMQKMIFSRLHSKNLMITITGPSRAGKTSFVRYLTTLIPERDSQITMSVPTMGKSVKRIKLGNSIIKTMDMGGQQNFWELWELPVRESDAIIFVVDGTSNNLLEIAKAFENIIQFRRLETPVLVILNKKDLILRGDARKFVSSGEFIALTQLSVPVENVLAIEASIFEGIAYNTSEYEEIPLAEIIMSFLDDYC